MRPPLFTEVVRIRGISARLDGYVGSRIGDNGGLPNGGNACAVGSGGDFDNDRIRRKYIGVSPSVGFIGKRRKKSLKLCEREGCDQFKKSADPKVRFCSDYCRNMDWQDKHRRGKAGKKTTTRTVVI